VVLMCAAVALLPTYSYLSATVMNGVLATFFASFGFYLCSKAVLDDVQQRHARRSWIGVVAGLGMLSKMSAIGFVGAALVLLVLTSASARVFIYRAAWFFLGVTSTAGWWFVRNQIVYGQWLKIIENEIGGDTYVPPPISWAQKNTARS
jgi:4-amino-4-deoxy-L-arabinose transferase-like glycosyltransferase